MLKRKQTAEEPTTAETTTTHATHDNEPPILTGREGDELTTVTLSGGGNGDGTFRVASLPQTLISGGSLYMLSDREKGLYAWRHP